MRRIKVALNAPKPIGHFIVFASFVASRMKDNPHFPSPNVPIATLSANIAELEEAQVRTLSHRNATGARNARREAVHGNLTALVTHVETVANLHPPEEAEAIIASSGFSKKQTAGPSKPTFKVKQLPLSGSVKLEVRHPGRGRLATFYWQYSTDGKSWVSADDTVIAARDIHGLTRGVLYWFRYRVRTSKVLGDWSDPITLLVV